MVQIYFQKFNKITTTYYEFPFIFCCCYFPKFPSWIQENSPLSETLRFFLNIEY